MKKKYHFIALGFLLVIFFITLPTIQSYLTKASFDKKKEVVTETIVVSSDELFAIAYKQLNLAQKLDSSTKYSLVADEVRDGYEEVTLMYHYLYKHPDIESIKVELPITRYQDNNKTIEFISGKGNIIKVLENGEWKDFETIP
ncbi:MAG: hypothetical protein H0Z34_10760 [Brevibacillus sp.]|nr:hypothetical protein [Brevibacillus sp.]